MVSPPKLAVPVGGPPEGKNAKDSALVAGGWEGGGGVAGLDSGIGTGLDGIGGTERGCAFGMGMGGARALGKLPAIAVALAGTPNSRGTG